MRRCSPPTTPRPSPSRRSTCRSRRCSRRASTSGEWRPGEAIPSEIELARRYEVSQGTVRKAIDALAADNLVVRRQGKGTFVATHTEERSSLFRFLRIRRNDGGDVAPVEPPARRQGAARPAPRSRGSWRSRPATRCWCCAACSTTTACRSCSTRSRCRRALFRGLTKARYDAYRGSMYSFFESRVRRAHAEGAGEARAPSPPTPRPRTILGTAPGTPLLAVDRADAHLRRSAGRGPPRPVRDARASLPERAAD